MTEANPDSTALVVDDQPELLALTAEVFKHLGYQVTTASNGEEAIALLTTNREFSVLFTDVVMPGINGIDLARQAKALAPNMHIVLTSGYLPGRNNSPGEWPFVPKPFRIRDLVSALAGRS